MARRLDRIDELDPIDPIDPLRRPDVISALPDISGDFGLVEDISTPSVDNFVAFPFEDVFFEGGAVDKDSQLTLGTLNRLKAIGRSERATGDEVFEKARPLITQLDNTRRRRRVREDAVRRDEFLAVSVEDAGLSDERAKADLEEAETKRDALADKIVNTESGENVNPVVLTSLRSQLAQLDSSLQALRTNAAETAAVFARTRSDRLAALAPPGGAKVEFEGGEVITRGPERIQDEIEPGPEGREELARIEEVARARREEIAAGIVQPVEPDEARKREIRRDFGARIKAAKTFEEKRSFRIQMDDLLAGREPAIVKARREVRIHDPIDAAGVPRTPELEIFVTKQFAGDIAKLERIKRAMRTARGRKAAVLQDQFDEIAFKLEDKIRAISDVQEERANTKLRQAEDAFDFAEKRFIAAEGRKDRDEITAAGKARDTAKATLDAAALVVEERKAAAALRVKGTAEVAAKAETVAAETKRRTDAVILLDAGVEGLDRTIFNDKGIIKEAKEDQTELLKSKTETADAIRSSKPFKDATKNIKKARARIRANRTKITEQEKHIAKIKGGFIPLPPLPSDPGEVISDEDILAYVRFYGDVAIAKKTAFSDGWKLE